MEIKLSKKTINALQILKTNRNSTQMIDKIK